MENAHYYLNVITPFLINLVTAVLVFAIGRWLARWLTGLAAGLMKKNRVDDTLVNFLKNICYYLLLIAVVIAALSQLGINTTSLLAILGAAGLAIGLALKDSLGNFAAGVMLILFKPFKVDDYVQAGGASGTVRDISIFNTELTTPDNQKVIVPNGSIMGNVITNVTAHDIRRLDLSIGISYDDDMTKAKDVLADILENESRILAEPAPVIAVSELGDSSVNLIARPWVKTGEYWPIRFDLIEKIKQEFDGADITIPFPQRDVHLYEEKKAG